MASSSKNPVLDDLPATIARFQRSGSLMNVNEEAARIFGLFRQGYMGLSQLREALIRQGVAGRVPMHIGDSPHRPDATAGLQEPHHKARPHSAAISRWEDEGGSLIGSQADGR